MHVDGVKWWREVHSQETPSLGVSIPPPGIAVPAGSVVEITATPGTAVGVLLGYLVDA